MRTSPLALLGLSLLIIALWLLIHPFRGVEHDSTLYTLLALGRLHPESLGQDLFVRYGTQNDFTVFSPIYASLSRLVGFERAAAVLTFLTHAAFFGCAWLLARRFMSASASLLATGLLVVLPAYYGSGEVFAYTESFITPRQPAAALVLAAIIAQLGSRRILTWVCLSAALLLHPLIALPGVVLCLLLEFGSSRPRGTALVMLGGTALLLVAAVAVPLGPFVHFDAPWLSVLQTRLTYLFPTQWTAATYGGVVVPLAVLVVGTCTAPDLRLRNLCLATAVTVIYGFAAGVAGGDLLHIAVASQLQTWRWLWLSMVMAIALSPAIAVNCWRAGPLCFAAAALLVSAWLTISDTIALLPAALACLCALAHSRGLGVRGSNTLALRWPRDLADPMLIQIGAWAAAAVAIAVALGQIHDAIDHVRGGYALQHLYDLRIRQGQALFFNGAVPALILVVAAWVVEKQIRHSSLPIAAMGIAACLFVLPYGIRTWTQIRYPVQRYAMFEPWRQAIAPATEVLWPDPPPDDWFLLGRPSYWSLYQMAGMVFSRDVTMITTRRETALTPLLPLIKADQAESAGSAESAGHSPADVCKLPDLRFFASWNDLGPTPYPPLAPDAGRPARLLRLYRCAPGRG